MAVERNDPSNHARLLVQRRVPSHGCTLAWVCNRADAGNISRTRPADQAVLASLRQATLGEGAEVMTPHSDADLVEAYLEDALTVEEASAVESRLKTDTGLADLLMSMAREVAIFREWAESERAAIAVLHELLFGRSQCSWRAPVPVQDA